MIKRFYVQNFLSIRDRIDISFEASKMDDDTYYNNLFSFQNDNILKVSAFYGINAAGKSNICVAFAALKELIIAPIHIPLTPYRPFKLDKEHINKPTHIGIEFSLDNHIGSPIYRYQVIYDKTHIIYEKLEKATSQKYSLMYERENKDNSKYFKFGPSIQANPLLDAIKNSLIEYRTFLSMFRDFQVNNFSDIYNFFLRNVVNIDPTISRHHDILPPTELLEDQEFRKFVVNLLKSADFNIEDIYVGKTKLDIVYPPNRDTLFFVHKSECSNGELEFLEESLGTKKIVLLAAHLYPVLSKSSILIIDELESSLHPELTKLVVRCFLDDTINPYNSQLIFTSHETTLLNLNLLRRDQINFVYKDKHTCGTYIRSLLDFHVRKSESVEKSYLAGRYFTSPEINEIYLERVNDE